MQEILQENALRRKQAFEIFKDFLEQAASRKGKGIKNRQYFYNFFKTYSDGIPFHEEENEYMIIGKLYRRQWNSENVIKSFTKEEQITVLTICDMFGANDYQYKTYDIKKVEILTDYM